ncbi:M56 family metallopeptidase [Chryseobacterium sp. GP-SGM7]|uniref:M56 family metallopeptidase n=1 Tax=Chryseobacterium sp. GP-SGM7 TaxID=3411323 RepID=UPI003B95DD17
METIILKTIICSGVLLGLYYLFLAKERTFIFNRFYLILALIFSFSIPFVTLETKQVEKEIPETAFVEEIEQPALQASVAQQESFDFTEFLIIASFIVTVILLLKIVYSVIKIKRLKGRKIIYQNRKVFLLKQNLAPFSFWNTIYLSENYLKDSKIDSAIFLHEEIHVKQKHSADILFVEILKALLWFNPFMYFYKNAMINNHEFIADESVILENKNVKKYQELILQEILKQQNLALIHQFNFNNTKKRFIMMTSKNSKFAKTKKYFSIPSFAILAIVFAEKTYAKDNNENLIQEKENVISKVQSNNPHLKYNHNIKKNDVVSTDLILEEFIKGKDTIPLKRNAKAQITDVNTASNKLEDKTVEDISKAVQGVAADLVPAEFPGGANKLRNFISSNFDGSILNGDEGILKSTITFIVDENGKVKDIKTSGGNEKFNNEAYRVIKLANENITWKPATKDGEIVAYQYKMPLTMSFESFKKTQ